MRELHMLTVERLPKRVDAPGAAQLLGFLVHEIPILVKAGLLKPLGAPAANGHKYFATQDLLDVDRAWLHKATRAVEQHWRHRNEQQRKELLWK